MSDKIERIIAAATADIEKRLEKSIPAFAFTIENNHVESIVDPPEKFPGFFENMPTYDADEFPSWLQQYMVLGLDVFCWSSHAVPSSIAKREYHLLKYDFRALDFGMAEIDYHSKKPFYELLENAWARDPFYEYRQLHQQYTKRLRSDRLNRLSTPAEYNSLEIVQFFKGSNYLKGQSTQTVRDIMQSLVDAVDHLQPEARTKKDVFDIVLGKTGLPSDSRLAARIVEVFALLPRIGILKSKHDRLLYDTFFETLQKHGYENQIDFPWNLLAVYQGKVDEVGCTKVQLRMKIREALGSFYDEVIEQGKKERQPEKKYLVQPAIVNPHDIKPANNITAGVRDLIDEATLNTGVRRTSSLMHNAPYRDKSRPLPPQPSGRKPRL